MTTTQTDHCYGCGNPLSAHNWTGTTWACPKRPRLQPWHILVITAGVVLAVLIAAIVSLSGTSGSDGPGFSCRIQTTATAWDSYVKITGPIDALPLNLSIVYYNSQGQEVLSDADADVNGLGGVDIPAGQSMYASDLDGSDYSSGSPVPTSCQVTGYTG